MNPIFERQIEELERRVGHVDREPLPSGAILLKFGPVEVPVGWNRTSTSIRFLAPAGYPYSQPDCFWADEGFALATGQPPQASQAQTIPETAQSGTWFSWHLQRWNPNKDSLMSFHLIIGERLRQVI